jgi:hypothetical protein
MSLARLKRLQRLESLRRPEVPTFDYAAAEVSGLAAFEWFAANVAAVQRHKAEWIEVHGPPTEPSPAKVAALAYFDGLARRLADPVPT